jgi:hypothetical protein
VEQKAAKEAKQKEAKDKKAAAAARKADGLAKKEEKRILLQHRLLLETDFKHLEVVSQLKGSCGWQIWIPPLLHPLSHDWGLLTPVAIAHFDTVE